MKSYDKKETAAGIIAGIIAAGLFLLLLFAVKWNFFISLAIAAAAYAGFSLIFRPVKKLGGVDADTVVGEEQVADTHDKHFVHTILGTGVAPAGGGMWCPPCPVSHGRRPCRRGCPGRDGTDHGQATA